MVNLHPYFHFTIHRILHQYKGRKEFNMESFLNLFDPFSACEECIEETVRCANINNQNSLPPEPQLGNVEYKLKIINPSKQRFEHLVTQVCGSSECETKNM